MESKLSKAVARYKSELAQARELRTAAWVQLNVADMRVAVLLGIESDLQDIVREQEKAESGGA